MRRLLTINKFSSVARDFSFYQARLMAFLTLCEQALQSATLGGKSLF